LQDLIIVIICAVLALLGHGARKKKWLEWLVRGVIGLTFLVEANFLFNMSPVERMQPWFVGVMFGMCAATGLLLIRPIRYALSVVLTGVESVASGQVLLALIDKLKQKTKAVKTFLAEKVFNENSIPHMVGLFIYVTSLAFLLGNMSPIDFDFPAMPVPLPVQLDQLFSYNGFGLILLSFCGVGIFITRKPKECLSRLGLVKPTGKQVCIGIALIFISFLYDAFWALYTHQLQGDLGSKLSMYNAGTFSVAGGFTASLVLALATALCAGIGEETLIRGALQPVFGIVPAAILHGVLHGQFSHAPVFIVQVALWSIIIGIFKRYTNTTTTIIGHAGFNLLTTFLFAFNP
jgi:hypothetical protein